MNGFIVKCVLKDQEVTMVEDDGPKRYVYIKFR